MLAASVSVWDIITSDKDSNSTSAKVAFQTISKRYFSNKPGQLRPLATSPLLRILCILYVTVSLEFKNVKFVSCCTKSLTGSLIITASNVHITINVLQRSNTKTVTKNNKVQCHCINVENVSRSQINLTEHFVTTWAAVLFYKRMRIFSKEDNGEILVGCFRLGVA